MECREFELKLDDWLDGRAGAVQEQTIRAHLAGCAACRRRERQALAIRDALRRLEPPAPTPQFLEQALSRATRPAADVRHGRRAMVGVALAASVVLAVALGAFVGLRPSPVDTVALTVEQPATVRLVFNSAVPLRAATMDVALPQNVEIVGYEGRRELAWQTDLREGRNLLQLPLVARGPVKDDLVARLSHAGSTKTFRLKIEVADSRRQGM